MDGIDGIVYINLDERPDRNAMMEEEFKRLNFPMERTFRLSGVLDRLNGVRGCLLSHIQALEMAQERGWEKVLILEDDVLFMGDQEEMNTSLQRFFAAAEGKWDVLFLGGHYLEKTPTSWEGIAQIQEGLCSHAYIVQNSYLQNIIEIFKFALEKINNDLFQIHSSTYALDRIWGILQKKDRWYGFNKQYALQRMLPSDIEIINTPLNRFDEVICIDRGNRERLREEFLSFGVSLEDLFWVKNHLEAIQLAKELKKKRYLILEDSAKFPENRDQFQLDLIHFFKWRGREWDLFLPEGDQCEKEPSDHFYFQKVLKLHHPKYYAVSDLILDHLHTHFSKGEKLDTFEIKSEMAVFCTQT